MRRPPNRSGTSRVGDADLAYLAMDRGPVPEQFAVVLVLGDGFDIDAGTRLLGERAARVPRLRQRVVTARGGPVWAEDPSFDPARHISTRRCRRPGNEPAVLEAVLPEVVRWLRRDRPLWRAVFVTGLEGGRTALALIVHHALADGLGGLAVLSALLDGGAPPAAAGTHPPHESRRWWRDLRSGMSATGGLFPGRVARSSLLRPTGSRRRALSVHADLRELHDAAHRAGATVNAAVLVAVGEALRRLLAYRGEPIEAVRVGVPVGGDPGARDGAGNAVGLMLLTVPVTGPRERRMARVAAQTRARRPRAAGPAPITVLGRLFRLAAATGGYRWYMTHQRRLHIVISCLRGPADRVSLAGVPVERMIPVAPAGAANLTMACQALSYAGELTVTTVADPSRCPDLGRFGRCLAAELGAVAAQR
ncbi:putative diacyglycerol O-acyltransferase [Paractinoplanes deccanensis]|uniref:diacylglycerol O-acyltransferase n=1 Tax=Paractinoplanes deccanensis TaxID=113561 RepID=A0ABQ3YER2_9ACTN|nr:wax ester/triacylglycerol synthase domain-containing protein [Actinoplanes deccanensis]GID78503.1 putative diacyglycerol O-acyltransferase [Actinoplanes deccanensis]